MDDGKKDLNMVLKKDKFSVFSQLALLESNLFRNGKRALSARQSLGVLRNVKILSQLKLSDFLAKCISNIEPFVKVITKKVGGGTYRIPVYIFPSKAKTLSFKWVVRSSCGRKCGAFSLALEKELSLAFRNEGNSIQKKKVLHNLAVSNRAYIKYL
jgi:small subunit ribosomal protein S7